MKSVLNYDDYRPFLRDQFPGSGETRGRRKFLADLLNCQPSFISLVITERAHMSEEMLLITAEFLRQTSFETDFLILIYHHERAGSKKLKNHYAQKIEKVRAEHSQVEAALNKKTEFSLETQVQYYSSWIYAAVHVACTLGEAVTLEFIAKQLSITEDQTKKVLEFLVDSGLAIKKGYFYSSTNKRIHLSRESKLTLSSHTSWRGEGIRQIQKREDKNLHFSSVYSLAEKDYVKIKKLLEEQILACEKIIAPSKEERLCALNLDFFIYGD